MSSHNYILATTVPDAIQNGVEPCRANSKPASSRTKPLKKLKMNISGLLVSSRKALGKRVHAITRRAFNKQPSDSLPQDDAFLAGLSPEDLTVCFRPTGDVNSHWLQHLDQFALPEANQLRKDLKEERSRIFAEFFDPNLADQDAARLHQDSSQIPEWQLEELDPEEYLQTIRIRSFKGQLSMEYHHRLQPYFHDVAGGDLALQKGHALLFRNFPQGQAVPIHKFMKDIRKERKEWRRPLRPMWYQYALERPRREQLRPLWSLNRSDPDQPFEPCRHSPLRREIVAEGQHSRSSL